MCLLKQSDRDTGCGHNECKSFYTLNKPMCVYNLQQSQSASQNPSMNQINSQIQLGSLLSQKPVTTITPPPSLNGKRVASTTVEHVIGEQETIFLNKKKVKPEDESKNEDINRGEYRNGSQSTFSDLSLSQQIMNQQQLSSDRTPQQMQFINGTPTANGQIFFTKPDGLNYSFNQPAIFIPVVHQTQQGNNMNNMNINGNFASFAQNQQAGFVPANTAQAFHQNMRTKPGISTNNFGNMSSNTNNANGSFSSNSNTSPSSANNPSSHSSNGSKNPNNATLEAFMKEFQSQTSGLLLSQNKMLLELKEKNDVIQDTLACLINEMSALKNTIKQGSQDKPSTLNVSPIMMSQFTSTASEVATTEVLLSYLYGPNYDFSYQLVLKNNIQLPLYRERNFKFTLLLTDKNGNLVENINKIPLTIAIYSSESTPKFIDSNTAGNKILKGFIEKDLVNGSVTFDKIQIKEVTSHFRNGWIFFIVYPKIGNGTSNNVLTTGKDTVVLAQKVKPFILEKVIVKAKKAKEKDVEQTTNDFTKNSDNAENAIFQEEEEENDPEETLDQTSV